MGKQINYYMTYESFLQVALDSGCLIIRRVHTDEKQVATKDITAITPECNSYYFYLPELGDLDYKKDNNGKYYLNYSFNQLGLAVIEAGFSLNPTNRARLYVMTGYYNSTCKWIPRSERITKVYDKLARKAKKVAQQIV